MQVKKTEKAIVLTAVAPPMIARLRHKRGWCDLYALVLTQRWTSWSVVTPAYGDDDIRVIRDACQRKKQREVGARMSDDTEIWRW